MKGSLNKKGFTLIELIVGVSIFTAVALAAIGTLSISRDGARRTQIIRTVLDNVNFAVEGMSRKIRLGQAYHCGSAGTLTLPNDCASGFDKVVSFTIDRGSLGCSSLITYDLDISSGKGRITVKEDTLPSTGCPAVSGVVQPLTSPDVDISLLRFYVRNTGNTANPPNDSKQPSVTMVVRGVASTPKGEKTTFSLETYATQRKLDE